MLGYDKDDLIVIWDFDGTIIDSSHRSNYTNGRLDLDHWKTNSTKENIFRDTLLPKYEMMRRLHHEGVYQIGCTARELSKHDWEFFFLVGLDKYLAKIISRPIGVDTPDWELKSKQLQPYFNLAPFKDKIKIFYDDNAKNRVALEEMGAVSLAP